MSVGRSYNQASAAKRHEFRRDDALELTSESQTELHEINVEYRYEVKHSDGLSGTSTAKDDIVLSASDLEKGDSRRSDITLSSPITSKSTYFQGTSSMSISCERHSVVCDSSLLTCIAFVTDPFPPSDKKRSVALAMPGSGPGTISGAYESGSNQRSGNSSRKVEREIKKMLLLNAYPILYVILWLPGILNRLLEAAGEPSYALTIMQCSTQYIGLANAITYGFNEHLKTSLRADFVKWWRARRE
jgi:hypothetical protein